MTIELKDAEKALDYLATTDEEFGRAKAKMLAGKEGLKREYAIAYLSTSAADKVDDRKSKAYISASYREALTQYENDSADYEICHAKRTRAALTIEFWRSLNSARSKGIVL